MDRRTAKPARRRRQPAKRRDGIISIQRLGVPREAWRDIYHFVLTASWGTFFAILITLYLTANVIFAVLYIQQPGDIAEQDAGSLSQAFFFSVETMATVGYGVMHPVTLYAHILSTIEIVFGVMAMPLATGLIIAKFTRPTARVIFSRNVVVAQFDGVPTLMFRLANVRANSIVQAHLKLTLLRQHRTTEGQVLRRLIDLPLVRDNNPMLALSWVVMHPITEESPFFGMTHEACVASETTLLAVLTGLDGTTSVTVYARHNYNAKDILFGRTFVDVTTRISDDAVAIDYRRFHDTRPVDQM
jgi:inward rectifier potassium channel